MTAPRDLPGDDGSDFGGFLALPAPALRARLASHLAQQGDLFLDRLVAHLREAEAAHEIARSFGDSLSVNALVPRLAERLGAFLGARLARVWMASPDGEELYTFEPSGERLVERRRPRERTLAGQALSQGGPLWIADVRFDPRCDTALDPPPEDAQSVLCVPLVSAEGEAVGVLETWATAGCLCEADAKRLGRLPLEAALALEKTRLIEELVRHSGYNESILDALGHAVLAVDTDGRVAKANGFARRLFRAEHLPGTLAAAFLVGPNAWVAELLAAVAASGSARSQGGDLALSTGRPLPPGYVERRRTSATVSVNASPLRAASGAALGTLLVIEDVTREKRLRGTLARYMTQEVADRLLEEGESALGGRLQKATVLFSDIRDFTTLSERLGPQQTVTLLNECFTLMVDIVLEQRGTLDKYLGDGLMAVFGAPYSSGHDASDALEAALDMLRALRDFNQRRAVAGQPRVQIGFGLNTDQVVSGNIGSPRRMDFTVIGDGVNLASRLEGANREYGTQLLISELTLAELDGSYLLREVDRLRVRGRQQPVAVFEVLDYAPPELLPHLRYVVSLYNEGLERYRQRQWEAARRMFDEALQFKPDDGPAQLYRRRCEHFLLAAPPDAWDGVWVLTSK